jgi:transcriptional regulator with XRE-family HTH domain
MSRETIANALKRLRQQSGLTAEQVGAMIGKSGKTVSAWENNHGQPDADMLIRLCDIYGVADILAEFRDEPAENISLNEHERALVAAYRAQPAMQPAVDKILGVTPAGDVADDIARALQDAASIPFPTQKK